MATRAGPNCALDGPRERGHSNERDRPVCAEARVGQADSLRPALVVVIFVVIIAIVPVELGGWVRREAEEDDAGVVPDQLPCAVVEVVARDAAETDGRCRRIAVVIEKVDVPEECIEATVGVLVDTGHRREAAKGAAAHGADRADIADDRDRTPDRVDLDQ